METPKDINKNTIREKYIKKHYNEFYVFLMSNFPIELSFCERIYWYYNGLTERPVCKLCKEPVKFYGFQKGYSVFCSNKCANNSNETRNKFIDTINKKFGSLDNYREHIKQSMLGKPHPIDKEKAKQKSLLKYGVEHYSQTTECKKKIKQTSIERYGVSHYTQTDECKKKIKQTKKDLYGDENYVNTNKTKKTCLERYGVDNFSKTETYKEMCSSKQKEIQQKIYKTKKKNNSFNSSLIEKQFETYLKENNINYKSQYKSELYPFNCDFYFPDIDLYLEIQGSWVHGGRPFDSTNKDDLLLLEQWKKKNTKFYDIAVNTWTVRDVLKRETAKKNNLNYFEVFTNNILELKNIYNSLITK